jgi:hypothetical protein
MLEASGNKVDTAVFERDSSAQFGVVVGTAAHLFQQSMLTVHLHDGFDSTAAGRGLIREIEDEGGETAEMVEELSEMVGEDFVSQAMGYISDEAKPPVTEEEYREALERKGEAEITLVDYTVGYHDFMRANLAEVYGKDDEQADEDAWTATWKKLREVMGGQEGTLLAEITGFFDGVARERFGAEYKHIEEDRGPAVSADVCARTFYEVMQDHLPRAIIGGNRDGWTGYQ